MKGKQMIFRSIISAAVLFPILASAPVVAQQIIYPAKGQTVEQQQKDEAECYEWAKQQTGYDPAQSTHYAAAPPQQSAGGERLGGAARGAAGGAIIGAIAGDAGKGAAIGAVGGTLLGGSRQRRQQADYDQAAAQQQQALAQQQQNYQRAYTACFEGRGYTVK
ncbi:MAG: hypothetical protein NMNS01_23020 [Nitrosomonas sp.]|nr:MAG: hypothetical protein NMNS01_23020 [Nitrosomonas sp.]